MFSKQNPEHIDMVINAILEKFAGQIVHNQVLKDYLHAKLPEMFPTQRGDVAVEHLAKVRFASNEGKKGVSGIAFLEGIKEGRRRFWQVPANTDNVVAKSDCIEELTAPIVTKKAKPKLEFGLIPAKKAAE